MRIRLLLRVVSCGSHNAGARGEESRKDIEHILNGALATIFEEDEPEAGFADDYDLKPTARGEQYSTVAAKHKKRRYCCAGRGSTGAGGFGRRRLARRRVMTAGIAGSYVRFMTAFASRGGLVGLSRF
ncbi:hypothetical protein Taro_040709 [Colocasia esculenta]|uniref:Uncharacterized protein n=1 Tax=Colocasia esculenta TaxID=4460 RepID=A0A843W9N4_COLES|nr:hypothetical protein [Colocasia esculenta]